MGVDTIFVFRFLKVHILHGFMGDTTEVSSSPPPNPEDFPPLKTALLSQSWPYSSVWYDSTVLPLVDWPEVIT